MNILIDKVKEVLFTVLPISLIVAVLHFTIVPIDNNLMIRFLLGAVIIIIGLSIFLLGIDIGITPVGTLMGGSLAKSNNLSIITIAGLALGFFISIAEPDLHVLADQVAFVTSGTLSKMGIVAIVSIGVAILMTLGLLRIVYNFSLTKFFTLSYILILIFALLASPEFLAIAFDASGATTGALTVPFMLALAVGVSALKKNGKASEEDSFGLVGIASAGAITSVLIMGSLYKSGKIAGALELNIAGSDSIIAPFLEKLPRIAFESLIALLPVIILFLVFNFFSFKLARRAFVKILKGFVYTFLGLVLFLIGVNAGFMDVGSVVGTELASLNNQWIVIAIGFAMGWVTVIAEPAVYVLTHQIEDITGGYVKRKIVLFALSLGVGSAVALSIVKILIPGVKLWHFLLPGYIIAIVLTYIVPKLFVGMAFDAGGVASGPMTATFILAFAQGAANAVEHADVLMDGFGIIAMVAMAPLVTLQILGLIFKLKSVKGGIVENESQL